MSENELDEEYFRKIIDENDIVGEVSLPAGWDGHDNDYDDVQTRVMARKKKNPSTSKNTDIEKIRERAFLLWAEKGCQENSALDHWLEAERQLSN